MSQISNKRVAKNTLMLYFRMIFMMIISLYTSRVILNTLGVEDYGIYNVVGGIITMFSFINWAMSSATQRYITFALGNESQEQLQKVFSTALQIHIILACVIALLGETIGLWFLYEKMQIPEERLDAAFWVLQFSVITSIINIVSVPYNADIVAHEKMDTFAYISIIEAILKLIIVYTLVVFNFDKLILYAFLLMMVQVLIRFCYSTYCHYHFRETIYVNIFDKKLFKEMMGFAGWSMIGNFAAVLFSQGLNMLLNVFFGPVVNAARAIAVQVQSTIQQFVSNFQMAINPQITKNYAQGNLHDMHKLIFCSARFSFYLLFLLSLPILLETKYILTIWLKNVPDNTVVFLRLMICTSLLYTLSNPLMIANQATGKIKKYQSVCGTILLLILPISYLFLHFGFPAYVVFIVHFLMEIIAQLARMILLRPLIGIKIRDYVQNIYKNIISVILVSLVLPFFIYFNMEENIIRLILTIITSLTMTTLTIYKIGLYRNERAIIKTKVLEKIKYNEISMR